jgi:hypothetical protein
MIGLGLGCVLLAAAARSLRTGSAQLINRAISRRAEPGLYWTGITIAGLGGVLLVLVAIVPQLQRL